MAFEWKNSKGVTYHLNRKVVTLRGGKEQPIFYFSKDVREDTATDLPDDMCIKENPRNGFLTISRGKRASGTMVCEV